MLRYVELVRAGDVDGVLALMSDDVSVEDPVGGPAGTHVVGKDAVATFFRQGFPRAQPRPVLSGPICATAGDEAAMPFRLTLRVGERDLEVDVIDVMTFDGSGRISKLRAFWDLAALGA